MRKRWVEGPQSHIHSGGGYWSWARRKDEATGAVRRCLTWRGCVPSYGAGLIVCVLGCRGRCQTFRDRKEHNSNNNKNKQTTTTSEAARSPLHIHESANSQIFRQANLLQSSRDSRRFRPEPLLPWLHFILSLGNPLCLETVLVWCLMSHLPSALCWDQTTVCFSVPSKYAWLVRMTVSLLCGWDFLQSIFALDLASPLTRDPKTVIDACVFRKRRKHWHRMAPWIMCRLGPMSRSYSPFD